MDWLAIVEENRAAQFRTLPQNFPVIASFYQRLLAGELGFAPVMRFAVEPEFLDVSFGGGTELSFRAFDHPVVWVFRRADGGRALAAWRAEMGTAPVCADGALREAAAALQGGASAAAVELAEQLPARHPQAPLANLLVAEAHRQTGDLDKAGAAYRRYGPEQAEGLMKYVRHSPFWHFIPGDAALACVDLGLEDLALRVLRRGIDEMSPANPNQAMEMAESYLEVGSVLMRRGQTAAMEEVLNHSLAIYPQPMAHNVLATTAYERGDYARAVAQWRASLLLNEVQGATHATLGQVLLARMGLAAAAIPHFERALQLEPMREAELAQWIEAARAALEP